MRAIKDIEVIANPESFLYEDLLNTVYCKIASYTEDKEQEKEIMVTFLMCELLREIEEEQDRHAANQIISTLMDQLEELQVSLKRRE